MVCSSVLSDNTKKNYEWVSGERSQMSEAFAGSSVMFGDIAQRYSKNDMRFYSSGVSCL